MLYLIADLCRQIPYERDKKIDSLVWNKTEQLLEDAEADVLEIFDW